MKRIIFIAAAPLALVGACSSGGDADGDGAISQEEAAAEAANLRLEPGQWEATVQLTEFEMEGMPEEMRGAMREQMGQPQTSTTCITPEQAANPQAEMFGDDGNDDCTYSEFNMSGGNMLIAASCQSGDMPAPMNMRMEGSYTPTSYEMTMNMDMAEGPTGPMRMSGQVTGRRVGECTDAAEADAE